MEVVIPTIVESGSSYLDWRPISRDQMMEEHVRAITTAVRGQLLFSYPLCWSLNMLINLTLD